jgi:two-component system response regulator HydG
MRSDRAAAHVLLATGDVPYGIAVSRFLQSDGFEVETCHDTKGVLRLINRKQFEIIVLDLDLSGGGDIDLVTFSRRQQPESQLILLFDIPKIERALEGIRRGAYFYLPKSSQPGDVALVVNKAVRRLQRDETLVRFQRSVFEETIGGSPAMRRVVEMVKKVAPTDSTVLLIGESGTGKEVLANAVHRLSPRREMAFVAVNCAALPESLLESELFGHVKGAFTGADADKRGLFEEADGGTLFLDEIGDMAPVTQAKLLRVLQSGEIRAVGSNVSKRVDARIIAATNKDLLDAVQNNKFREDLYFRLNVVQIRIPPLRERLDALPALISHFLSRFNDRFGKSVEGIDQHATALLHHYEYPGNVRELESIIAHAVIMCDGTTIMANDLPESVRTGSRPRLALPNYSAQSIPTLQQAEEQLIRTALQKLQGNQTETAKRLGISRSTLWRKMREYNIQDN